MSPASASEAPGFRRRLKAAGVQALALATAATAALLLAQPGQQPSASGTTELDASPVAVTDRQIAVPEAPMGWASWNAFAAVVNYEVIKKQVDAFVAAGLPQAGYEYINIDEGWWQGTRDSAGNITVDESEWPGGMKAIADYIHSKGLKAGIYTDAGKDGCGYYFPTGRPAAPGSGSEGHYEQDMTQFSKWGFDFVKVDWCGGDAEGLDPKTTYQAISDAVTAATATTGRPLALSLCNWGYSNPWNWAPGMGPMWRTNTDIFFHGNTPSYSNVLTAFDRNIHPTAQHTGYYNDPDMMVVGMNGLTAAQNRSHMNLWAISGAPLLAGLDLTTLTTETTNILTNPEVIAVDQDPRGLQGVKVAEDTRGLQVYGKVLSGSGNRAVVLLNRTSTTQNMTVRWSDLGLTNATATVRDLWARTNVATTGTSYTTGVPANSSVILTVKGGTEQSASTYNGTASFSGVVAGSAGLKTVDVSYTNNTSAPVKATLTVNGQTSTKVSFPPTGSSPGNISVAMSLKQGSANTISFSGAPTLEGIVVRPLPGKNGTLITGTGSGRCADINNNTISNGTDAQLWDCTGGQNQVWQYNSTRKELVVYGNKCLDAYNRGTTNGTRVVIWDCTGGTNQQWNVNSDGTITNVNAGLCLDAYGAATTNGTKLVLWSCNGQNNQKWSLT
ncbi:ricin-type beta-trefoil lectin domain protein [Streptomyces ipomoeae]|uniref:ricin-type beta-trefoil lectin domain protein n=1 Tax=Streptomyces ipomoeae TaxID=103232 RepID=UPI0011465936|nr:ricin-type beta-trefoil lectin domain protein [Streptomyces ipomoeae]MDX2938170.1 RICIN domain-containing protein [Streptomyces ipomoeae]TQE27017.1 alpha-galactosidase [Streptomyces ipomoeae]